MSKRNAKNIHFENEAALRRQRTAASCQAEPENEKDDAFELTSNDEKTQKVLKSAKNKMEKTLEHQYIKCLAVYFKMILDVSSQ